MVTRRTQNRNFHSSLTAACDWSKKWNLPINPTKCNYLTFGRESPLRLSVFPVGYGTAIPVSKLVNDLGVQTDNMFSPTALCTEAANKARRLVFMIRRSLQDLSKPAVVPIYGACSPNLGPDINHLERIQRLATGLVTGSSPTKRDCSGWAFIPCRGDGFGLTCKSDYHIQNIHGRFGY